MEQVTLSGIVVDAETGEPLPIANVYGVRAGADTLAQTDFAGRYAITVDVGSPVRVSYVGYTPALFTAPEVPPADPPTHRLVPGYALDDLNVYPAQRSGIGAALAMFLAGLFAASRSPRI